MLLRTSYREGKKVKHKPIANLSDQDALYITAITKPQMMTLLKAGKIHKNDFSDKIKEVVDDGVRYILRRNPVRTAEILKQQADKIEALKCPAQNLI